MRMNGVTQEETWRSSLTSLHRFSGTALLRSALCVAVLMGFLLAYWASTTNEQVELPGISAQVRVETLAKHHQPERVLEDFSAIAHRTGGDIFVEIPSPKGRTVYGAGPSAEDWINHGYCGLIGAPALEMRNLTDLPHGDYRQVIELSGGTGLETAVEKYLQEQGIEHEMLRSQEWQFLLGGTAMGSLLQLVLGLCGALCIIGVLLNARAEAVRLLHGYGVLASSWYELRRAAGAMLLAGCATVVGLFCVCGGFGNWSSALQLARYTLIFVGVNLTLCAVAVGCTVWFLRRANAVALLAGKLPVRTTFTAVMAVRLGACVVLASMSISALNYSVEWHKQQQEAAQWAEADESYALELSGARSLEDRTEASHQLATRLRAISAEGRLLFAQYLDPGANPLAHADRDFLVYNEAAAQRSLRGSLRDVYDAAPHDGRPLWLEPEQMSQEVDREALREELHTQKPWVTQRYAASDATAWTWQVGEDEWMNRAVSPQPIVVVVPNNDLMIGDRNLVAALTQKAAMLTDYADYQRLQSDDQVGSFIRVATPMSQLWSSHHQTMGRTLWVYVGGFIAALLFTVIAALAVMSTWRKLFHQKLRACYVHGVVPVPLWAEVIVVESVVMFALMAYLWQRGAPVREWSSGGIFAGAADPSLMAMFRVPPAAWWLTLVVAFFTALPWTTLCLRGTNIRQLITTRR